MEDLTEMPKKKRKEKPEGIAWHGIPNPASRSGHNLYWRLLLVLLWGANSALGVIIPPKWANVEMNPCAQKSWQLLYWPNDQKCYRIFSQGPCDDTQEFYFDKKLEVPNCRCSRGSLWDPLSSRCYEEFSRGPCQHGEYIEKSTLKLQGADYIGMCQPYEKCPPGLLFWPPTKKCYPLLSRGPCLHGHLLYVNPETGIMDCGCKRNLMNTNYWAYEESCHELYTRGPCIHGHIYVYNLTKDTTECICEPDLKTNYHHETSRCYELNTLGPCQQGQVFTLDTEKMEAVCTCLPGYIKWEPTGDCYREYTQGPCPQNHFLHSRNHIEYGGCSRKICKQGQLYHPKTNSCYPVGRRGPCPHGQIWVFERATSVKGMCHCDPKLVGYWEPHKICYELGERGPCSKNKVLSYNKLTRNLACKCDYRRGYVAWTNGGCLKRGLSRKRINPVVGTHEGSLLENSILSKRIHRGLTLPLREGYKNATTKKSYNVQQAILNDIQQNLHNNTCTDEYMSNKCFQDAPLLVNSRRKFRRKSNKQRGESARKSNSEFETGEFPRFEALKITREVTRITSSISSTSSQPNSKSRTTNQFVEKIHSSPSHKAKIENSNARRSKVPKENKQNSIKIPPKTETQNSGTISPKIENESKAPKNKPSTTHSNTPMETRQGGSGNPPPEISTKDLLQEIFQRRLMKIRKNSGVREIPREEIKRQRRQRQNLHLRKVLKNRKATTRMFQ